MRAAIDQNDAERYRTILELIPQMVWSNEPDGTEYYSRRWLEFTGVDVEHLADLDRYGLIHPEDVERAARDWDEAQASGLYESEYRLKHHSGDFRWMVSRGSAVRDEDGRICGWYGSCTDVHDRLLYREALSISEALNRSIIEGSSDPTAVIGADGVIIFMNEAARKEVGPELAGSAVGSDYVEHFMAGLEEADAAMKQAAAGERSRFTLRFVGASGPRWWDVSLTPIHADGGGPLGVLAAARDITEARHTAAQVQELQHRMLHLSRLRAMGTMAATLAHELNQPLAAAANYLQGSRRLLDADMDKADIREALEEAIVQVQRAGEIIRRSRNMIDDKAPKAARASLQALVHSALKLCAGAGGKIDAEVQTSVAPGADQVHVDAVQTEQVLGNLIRNALQAMRGSARRELTICARAVGSFVKVEVRDTGPGIPPGQEEEVFHATHGKSNDGLGLGLPISRTIIERQGGTIWAAGNPGGGASFYFTLPLHEAQ